MKKYLQFKLLVIGLIISSSLTFAQVAPTLGVAADFVLFSSIGAVTNVGSSKVTGNVGSNSGAVSGFGNVNGQMHNGNGVTAATASALNTAYLAIGSQTPTIFPAVLLGGQTFTPAVIQVAAPSSIVGTLTLNGLGNPNAVFIIKLNGAFSMAASAKIVLINGAKACNVFWKIEGLVTIATGASLVGNFIVNGEIVLGAGTQLEGRAMSIVGAITVNGVKASTPIGCGSPVLNGPALPNIGRTGCYALLTANGALTSTGTTQIVGDVGTNLGPVSGFVPLNVIGTIHSVPDTSTAGAAADLGVLYTNLNALPFDIQLLYPAQFGNSQVLTPHTYRMIGAAALTDTIFLDALGNPNAVFVIQINGALTTSTYAKVILQGGTKASNVFWKVEGLVTMGTYTTFQGTLVVNNAAIVMNIGDTLNGRGLSTVGAITANSAVVRITGGGGSSVSASGPLNFCEGDSVTLTAGSSSSYKWSRGDTTQSIKVKVSGTHYVITNSCAGKDTSANIVVIVSALPTALITPLGISNLCMGDSVLLKTKDSIGLSYQWQRDTVNIVGANDSMYWAKTAGNYTVKVTNVANCSKTSPIKIVNFNPYPVANINNVGPLTFCQGDSVKLVSDTLSGLTRQWKRNGVNILNATDS
ncbi:MAG: ice-binding family protein, partial [bacterium]|nr:ice-binding family protein [bacterium]